MQNQLGAKQLQRTLSKEALLQLNTQRNLPAEIKVSSTLGLRIRNTIMRLPKVLARAAAG